MNTVGLGLTASLAFVVLRRMSASESPASLKSLLESFGKTSHKLTLSLTDKLPWGK